MHWLSVPDHVTNKWHTELVLGAVILFFFFLPNDDRLKQLSVATKVWLFLVLNLSSRAKNVLDSAQIYSFETFINIANAFVLQRSLANSGKLNRSLDSKPNTYPDVLSKQDLITLSRSPHSVISTKSVLDFSFPWLDSVTRLLKTSAWSSEEAVKICSKLCVSTVHSGKKFPKLWTNVAHSFLQQIAQNKNWAHPKANTLPRIYKVEMEPASLLFYLAKPQSGGIWGCDLRHCTSEPFDSRRFVEACRA